MPAKPVQGCYLGRTTARADPPRRSELGRPSGRTSERSPVGTPEPNCHALPTDGRPGWPGGRGGQRPSGWPPAGRRQAGAKRGHEEDRANRNTRVARKIAVRRIEKQPGRSPARNQRRRRPGERGSSFRVLSSFARSLLLALLLAFFRSLTRFLSLSYSFSFALLLAFSRSLTRFLSLSRSLLLALLLAFSRSLAVFAARGRLFTLFEVNPSFFASVASKSDHKMWWTPICSQLASLFP